METTINPPKKLSRKGRIYIIRTLFPPIIGGIVFFSAAGQLTIPRGWIYFILSFFMIFLSNLIIARYNPEIFDQRSRIQSGTKTWDKYWLLAFVIVFIYGMPFVAGWEIGRMDRQFNHISLYAGILSYLLSVALLTWSMAINRFFESSVRIQNDRGHHVVSDGPYQIVRHPGYFAIIFWAVGFPLIVGSRLALYQGFLLILFTALRTYFEDRTLLKELPGYPEYAARVRFRLIPYIW